MSTASGLRWAAAIPQFTEDGTFDPGALRAHLQLVADLGFESAWTIEHVLGAQPVLGLSTHDTEQLRGAAAEPLVDYFCAGPVWTTPTKVGRPAVGLSLIDDAAAVAPADRSDARPWFAIGGIDEQRLGQVLERGARRVVVVRAITEAEDPGAAAAAIAARLHAAD